MPAKKAETVTFLKLEPGVPDPKQIAPGLFELALYAGDKERVLMQNYHREFSTRMRLGLPEGHALLLFPGSGMTTPRDKMTLRRTEKMIAIDPGSQLVRESADELIVELRNYGFGAHHPSAWEFTVYVLVIPLAKVDMWVIHGDQQAAEAVPETATA